MTKNGNLKAQWLEHMGYSASVDPEWPPKYTTEEEALHSELENGSTPLQWIEARFTPDRATDWMQVGGFDAEKCRELEDAGFSPEELEEEGDWADAGYSSSIAYTFSNNDLSLDEVKRLIGQG